MDSLMGNGREAPVFRSGLSLQCGGRTLDLAKPAVMGVLNVTPDSFSDGGQLLHSQRPDLSAILTRAEAMVAAGAAILDVGGESTRPGAAPVSEAEELDRVVPVVERLTSELEIVVSVDTSTAAVMREAAGVGAGIINDVRALQRPGALEAAAATGLPICLMHMQGEPDTMQTAPVYSDVVEDVLHFLEQRVSLSEAAGIGRQQIMLDPGFGFGKTLEHNVALMRGLGRFVATGMPVMVGVSRKSMIGALTGREVGDRLAGSLALATAALLAGAAIIRVHDVPETCDVAKIVTTLITGQVP